MEKGFIYILKTIIYFNTTITLNRRLRRLLPKDAEVKIIK
jgi:hypothetical protein